MLKRPPPAIPPIPETFGPLRVGDTDTRTRDWGDVLAGTGDTIASMGAVTIRRMDRLPMTSADLVVTGAELLDEAELVTTLTLTGGVAGRSYIMTMQVTTTQGRILRRDGVISVEPLLG